MTEIHVRNMVCGRCIKAVTQIFRNAGLPPERVELGIVYLEKEADPKMEEEVREQLKREGFEWLDDKKVRLTEKVKREILKLVESNGLDEMNLKLSSLLSSKLVLDYHYISNTFSAVENITIEQYFILQKIEKVKEWLVYDELSLSEMAYRLGYSSVAHLSAQFKKMTGFTPSRFRKLKEHRRTPIDKI